MKIFITGVQIFRKNFLKLALKMIILFMQPQEKKVNKNL